MILTRNGTRKLNFEKFVSEVNKDGVYAFSGDACELCEIYKERFGTLNIEVTFVEIMNWELPQLKTLMPAIKGLPATAVYDKGEYRVLNGDAPDSMILEFICQPGLSGN